MSAALPVFTESRHFEGEVMARIISQIGVLAFAAVAAIGCSGPDLQPRVDELSREREDLIREKTSL